METRTRSDYIEDLKEAKDFDTLKELYEDMPKMFEKSFEPGRGPLEGGRSYKKSQQEIKEAILEVINK